MSRTGKHRSASGCAAEHDEHSKTSADSEKLSPDDAKVQSPGVMRRNNEEKINITALNTAKNNLTALWFLNIFAEIRAGCCSESTAWEYDWRQTLAPGLY